MDSYSFRSILKLFTCFGFFSIRFLLCAKAHLAICISQVVVGSFTCGNIKGKNKSARIMEGGGVSQHLHVDNSANLESVQPNQTLASSSLGIWPVSQQMDVQTAHVDIDLMH